MPTTVVKTIGSTGDYSTPALWEAGAPADLTTVDQIWQGQLQNQLFSGTGTQLTIAGTTTDATRYKELTTVAGASWRDNANVQTNAFRYNSSNGAAISGSSGYTYTISSTENYARLTNIQVEASSASGTAINMAATGNICRNIISEHRGADGWAFAGASCAAYNCLILGRKSSMGNVVKIGAVSGVVLENCLIAVPSGLTAPTVLFTGNYGSATLTNCGFFSGPIKSGSTTHSYTTCYTDQASPPSGVTQTTYSTSTFANITDGSHDYKLVTGSALVNTGTTDSTNVPTDAAGTSRPQGAAYDVGPWELVVSGGGNTITVPLATLTLNGLVPTVAVSNNQSVAVPLGALTMTGFAPTVTATANQTVAVPLGTLSLTGFAPTVVVNANQTVVVPLGTMTLTGFAPTVVATANNFIQVPAGTLALTGFAPSVSNGTTSGGGRYDSKKRKRHFVKIDGEILWTASEQEAVQLLEMVDEIVAAKKLPIKPPIQVVQKVPRKVAQEAPQIDLSQHKAMLEEQFRLWAEEQARRLDEDDEDVLVLLM